MRKHCLVICLLFAGVRISLGQISPGELTTAHHFLEGIDNCTRCHSIGKALTDDKCVACHNEIRARINLNKGFHATIGGKHCFECHKEHHGQRFEIIRFDKKLFNHSSVGFALQGAHARLECEKCHTKDRIAARDIQGFSDARKQKTFLGLSQECRACHQDQHRGQFTQQCSACHAFDKWKPASKFNHADTKYPLTGLHEKVACLRCHKNTFEDGKTVRYTNVEHGSCRACHADPHKGKFPQECDRCHTTSGFLQVKGGVFNHSVTQFPLKGKHAHLKCDQCHSPIPTVKNISGELGFHITKFRQCKNCHTDAHAGQFTTRTDNGRCEACHTENGFTIVQFTTVDHAKTKFPLTGAHIATPCVKCHLAGKVHALSTRQFRWTGALTCTTCHADIHKGQFAARMTNGCETCHKTDSWQAVNFSHEKTNFPLRGKHVRIECSRCHKKTDNQISTMQFARTPNRCYDCHKEPHEQQFAIGGVTQCDKCHTEEAWASLSFNHNTQARFVLKGKHATVPCVKCHKTESINQHQTVRYKPLGTACADCHQSKE
jgi:hypothetical protein